MSGASSIAARIEATIAGWSSTIATAMG